MDSKEELERLKAEFRKKRLAMCAPVQREAFASDSAMFTAARQLREFCVAGGHDLAALDAFVKEVEEELQSHLAM
jgi:hypothetical protein